MSSARPRAESLRSLGRLVSLVREQSHEALLSHAVAEGLLDAATLATARGDLGKRATQEEGDGATLIKHLVAQGSLTSAQVDELTRAAAAGAYQRPSLVRAAHAPPEVEAAAANPDRRLDDFVLIDRIGSGGAGRARSGRRGTRGANAGSRSR